MNSEQGVDNEKKAIIGMTNQWVDNEKRVHRNWWVDGLSNRGHEADRMMKGRPVDCGESSVRVMGGADPL